MHTCFRLALAHPRGRPAGLLPLLLYLFQLLDRLFQALDSLPRRALPGRPHPPALLLGPLLLRHRLDHLSRRPQVLLDRSRPPQRTRRTLRADARAVDHHLFQIHQPGLAQQRQQLREQIVQRCAVRRPKIRQRFVADRLQTAQPLQGRMIGALAFDIARRTEALAIGPDPDADQQARFPGGPAGLALKAAQRRGEPVEIESPAEFPDRPRRMVGRDQRLDIDGGVGELAAVGTPQFQHADRRRAGRRAALRRLVRALLKLD